jgi:hypothetical protein
MEVEIGKDILIVLCLLENSSLCPMSRFLYVG